ncbi:hypothetical protein ACVILH_004700 [Bradyrhizobium sp. USDA 4353]
MYCLRRGELFTRPVSTSSWPGLSRPSTSCCRPRRRGCPAYAAPKGLRPRRRDRPGHDGAISSQTRSSRSSRIRIARRANRSACLRAVACIQRRCPALDPPARVNQFIQPHQADLACPVLARKRLVFRNFRIRAFLPLVPPRHEGRIAIVTTRGVGCDGRLEPQHGVMPCGRTAPAHAEIAWSWSPDAEATPVVTMIAGNGGKTAGPRGECV